MILQVDRNSPSIFLIREKINSRKDIYLSVDRQIFYRSCRCPCVTAITSLPLFNRINKMACMSHYFSPLLLLTSFPMALSLLVRVSWSLSFSYFFFFFLFFTLSFSLPMLMSNHRRKAKKKFSFLFLSFFLLCSYIHSQRVKRKTERGEKASIKMSVC